ncbi:hypothetical protein Tco_0388793, partial [Tanacetum coccineum]
VVDVVKKDRKQTKAEIPALVTQEFNAFKAKYEKYFGSTESCRHDAFLKRDHDDHLYDDALLTREKSTKRQRSFRVYDETPDLLNEFQSFDMRVPTIAYHKRIEDTLKDMIKNQFTDAEEYAYHLEQAQNYMETQIVWENGQEDLITLKKDTLLFYGTQRNPNEPPRYLYNMDLFYLKNENTEEKKYVLLLHKIHANSFPENDLEENLSRWNNIEDMYYMCQNKKVNIHENRLLNSLLVFIRSCVIWERVHDSQLGIKSYQKKINRIAPTLTVYGIDELNTYYVFDVPFVGIVYLNNKEEKRIMGLTKILKFYDATLEKVLKEVKLKIVESEYKLKTLVLGNLDLKIMKTLEERLRSV